MHGKKFIQVAKLIPVTSTVMHRWAMRRESKAATMLLFDVRQRKFTKQQLLQASIAQLGERETEDLEAPCSTHGRSRRSSSSTVHSAIV